LIGLAFTMGSVSLGIFSAAFLGLTITTGLYNFENVLFRLGLVPTTEAQWTLASNFGLALCGLTLLGVGLAYRAGARHRI
ncbi:MAG: hypothetical protein ACRDLB_12760, partial [Actinomycetota bacterium]